MDIAILGYTALFFSGYDIICSMAYRLANNNEAARSCDIECSIWAIAAIVAFK